MAQGRMIDNRITTSEKVNDLPVLGMLIYTWAIARSDDFGLLPGSPRTIKAQVIPMVDASLKEVEAAISKIIASGLWVSFEHQGKSYYYINQFSNFQHLRKDQQPHTIIPFELTKNYADNWKNIEKIIDQYVNREFEAKNTSSDEVVTSSDEIASEEKRREENNNNTNKRPTKKPNEKATSIPDAIPVLEEILALWNDTYQTSFTSVEAIKENGAYWLAIYTPEQIKQAVLNIKYDNFWKDKMTPTILFRRKNPQKEGVDYIANLMNIRRGATGTGVEPVRYNATQERLRREAEARGGGLPHGQH